MGKHYLLNLYGCSFVLLNNEHFLIDLLENAAISSGATVIQTISKKFEPQGVTVICLLAERHIKLYWKVALNNPTFIRYSRIANGSKLTRTDWSSMEVVILTCLQAQLVAGRVYRQELPRQANNDLIWEIKQISPKNCTIDTKVDWRGGTWLPSFFCI